MASMTVARLQESWRRTSIEKLLARDFRGGEHKKVQEINNYEFSAFRTEF